MSKDEIIAKLNAEAVRLRARGILHVSLFGSYARGTHSGGSDVDLAIEVDPAAELSGYDIVGLECELAGLLGSKVDIIVRPVRRQSLNDEIEKDGVRAF